MVRLEMAITIAKGARLKAKRNPPHRAVGKNWLRRVPCRLSFILYSILAPIIEALVPIAKAELFNFAVLVNPHAIAVPSLQGKIDIWKCDLVEVFSTNQDKRTLRERWICNHRFDPEVATGPSAAP